MPDVLKWPIMPRRLLWTREKPTESGYYWSRFLKDDLCIVFVYVESDSEFFEVPGEKGRWPLSQDGIMWAGPIPEPEEP